MNFKYLLYKTARETKEKNILIKTITFYIIFFLHYHKHHNKARLLAHKLVNWKADIGYFYLAELDFLYGNFQDALDNLDMFSLSHINPDAVYLKVRSLMALDRREEAFHILEKFSYKSSRLKTWLMLANIVNNSLLFERLERAYHDAINKNKKLAKDMTLKRYIVTAASRAKEYEKAKIYMRDILLYNTNKKQHQIVNKKNKLFKTNNAAIALKDISEILTQNNIEMFLVSGTFLGCVREGKLLSHDHDVDVGIWDNYTQKDITKLIQKSGKFYIHEPLSDKIIKAKHINGVLVDIFIHYKENGLIYHEGVKSRWHNQPFDLIPYRLLGTEYLGAKDYDTYLSENYGDWRTPKKDFDYVLDTPNMKPINNNEMILHLYGLLTKEYAKNNIHKIYELLEKLGEEEFVKNYKNYMGKQ